MPELSDGGTGHVEGGDGEGNGTRGFRSGAWGTRGGFTGGWRGPVLERSGRQAVSVAPGPAGSASGPTVSGAAAGPEVPVSSLLAVSESPASGTRAPVRGLWSRFAAWLGFREGRLEEDTATPPGPDPIEARIIDAKIIEELAKLQRGLRRLSLAHEQHGEQLQGVAARLQDLDQNVMRLALRGAREVTIDEDTWLRCLDRLDQCLRVPGLPESVGESLRALHEALCTAAGWRAVAILGAAPEGVHLRIAEVLPDPGATSYRIRHILEQGYLRPDGGAVRPAVVVVAGPKHDARGESPPSGSVAPESSRVDPPIGPPPGGDLS
ncbi:MAG: hypothetical protein M3495_07900 [Pseudomonadota bacterium]|nr:hypothetical protein [Pseudomonadota bacterium]